MDVKMSSVVPNGTNAASYDNSGVSRVNKEDVAANTNTKDVTTKDVEKEKNVGDDEKEKKVFSTKELDVKDAKLYTEALNSFFKLSHADLKLSLHQKTQTLMVQLVDTSNNKVLREFPPKELLDAMAKIHDYIGALLDKKA